MPDDNGMVLLLHAQECATTGSAIHGEGSSAARRDEAGVGVRRLEVQAWELRRRTVLFPREARTIPRISD